LSFPIIPAQDSSQAEQLNQLACRKTLLAISVAHVELSNIILTTFMGSEVFYSSSKKSQTLRCLSLQMTSDSTDLTLCESRGTTILPQGLVAMPKMGNIELSIPPDDK